MAALEVTAKISGGRDWRAMFERLATAGGLRVVAGVSGPEAQATAGDDVRVVDKARWTEFGVRWEDRAAPTPKGAGEWFIPPRPAFRTTFAEKREAWTKAAAKALFKVARGTSTTEKAGALIGVRMAGDIRRSILTGDWKPNAQRTIDAKGSSRPWVDSGQTVQSIRWRTTVKGRETGVG